MKSKLKVLIILSLLCFLFSSPVYAKDFSVIGNKLEVSSLKPSVNVVGIKYNLGLDYRTTNNVVNLVKTPVISSSTLSARVVNNTVVKSSPILTDTYTVTDFKSCILSNSTVVTDGIIASDFIEEEPEQKIEMGEFDYNQGTFQGPWGDLSEYVEQLSGRRKNKTKELLPYVGAAPINEGKDNYEYNVDRWKEINGKGTVRYSQGGATLEDWAYLSSGDSNFVSSACGAYSASCVLSTMLGKYINVPEVSIAINTYELRHQGSNLALSNSNGDYAGAFTHTDLAVVIEECGLKTEVSDYFNQEQVDNCLNNGGMVIYVVNSGYGRRYTGNAHYIVIREKTETGYLVYSSTNWASDWNDDYCNTENTAQELKNLQGYNGAQMVLVNY